MESAAARGKVGPIQDYTQVVRRDMCWAGYEGLVSAFEDSRHVRLAYDGEVLRLPGYTTFQHNPAGRCCSDGHRTGLLKSGGISRRDDPQPGCYPARRATRR